MLIFNLFSYFSRPFGSHSDVSAATDSSMNAYRGMQLFAKDNLNNSELWIEKADYEEIGANVFKTHCCSNTK